MKNNRIEDIEHMLHNMRGPKPDEYRKKLAVNRAVLEFTGQPVRSKKPFYKIIMAQAGYISPVTWILQFVIFLCIVWFLKQSAGAQMLHLVALSVGAPLFGLVGVTEVTRSFSHQMWELENTCRYNLRYVLGMKMLVLGLADLFLFSFLLQIGIGQGSAFPALAVCLLVPFHLSNIVYLLILMKTDGRCTIQTLCAVGLIMAALSFYFSESLITAESSKLEVLGRVGIFGILLLTFIGMLSMIAAFLARNSWEEQKVWN